MRAKSDRSLLSEVYATCPDCKIHLFPPRNVSAVVPFQCLLMTHLLLTEPTERNLSDFWLLSENGEENKMCLQSEWNFVTLGLVAKLTGW
jgi:hypothetical protein